MRRFAELLDYRWRLYAALAICMLAIASAKPAATLAIDGYQKYISPHKGYRCAHAALYGGPSCSELGKRAIRDYGIIGGLMLLREHFRDCHEAAVKLRTGALAGGARVDEVDDCFGGPRKQGQEDAREATEYCTGCVEGFCEGM